MSTMEAPFPKRSLFYLHGSLQPQAREIIYNVFNYFTKEKVNGGSIAIKKAVQRIAETTGTSEKKLLTGYAKKQKKQRKNVELLPS